MSHASMDLTSTRPNFTDRLRGPIQVVESMTAVVLSLARRQIQALAAPAGWVQSALVLVFSSMLSTSASGAHSECGPSTSHILSTRNSLVTH